MYRRPYRRNYAQAVGSSEGYPLPWWVPWLSGAIGATLGAALGRPEPRTRLANAAIGGIFTGSAAYIDYQTSISKTLLVAAVEGAIWGITDRTTPLIKHAILGHPEDSPAATQVA